MIHHLTGSLVELTPTHAVVECGGVGYFVHLSLHTSSALAGKTEAKVLIHAVYREDAQLLFGFAEDTERRLFVMLTSVSGVGAQTARMILSGLGPAELVEVITRGDVAALKAVKGIGAKTAQRILVDLQDKMGHPDVLLRPKACQEQKTPHVGDMPEQVEPPAKRVDTSTMGKVQSSEAPTPSGIPVARTPGGWPLA